MTASFTDPCVERAILGCILECCSIIRTLDLKPEDFALSSHSSLFGHMQSMAENDETIDVVTLVSRLQSHGQLEQVGGREYVSALVDGVIREDHERYATILKEYAIRRHLLLGLEQAAKRIADPAMKGQEVIAILENLSARFRDEVLAERKIRFHTAKDLGVLVSEEVSWIAFPWVAAGGITLTIGKVKSAGKTTFITHLVRAVLDGARFMDGKTNRSPVVFLTEQSRSTFKVALKRAGLLGHEDLKILFWAETAREPWPEVVGFAVEECKRIGSALLVVDTIGQFTGLTGDAENNAGDALRAMQPLQRAAAGGLGILVSQHERKSGGEVEDSGRGSSAFSGAADIVLAIRRNPGQGNPCVRVIRALSRYDGPPAESVVELTPEGYIPRDPQRITADELKAGILAVIPRSEESAVQVETLCELADVKRTAGQKALEELVVSGQVQRAGIGVRGSPYRYWSPEILSATNLFPIRQKENLKTQLLSTE